MSARDTDDHFIDLFPKGITVRGYSFGSDMIAQAFRNWEPLSPVSHLDAKLAGLCSCPDWDVLDRAADRIKQRCRKAGLLAWDSKTGWRKVDAP